MASCYKVFEYWREKCIPVEDALLPVPVVRDEYCPECWACGRPAKNEDVYTDKTLDMKLTEVWSDKRINSRLQRCHIVAKQFGGSDAPENLFLLCDDCHEDSPDTKNPATFFRWVYRRRSECRQGINLKRFYEEFVKEIEMRGYDVNDFAKKVCTGGIDYEKSVLAAFHEAGTHGTRIVESSIVGCIVDELELLLIKHEKQKILKREEELSNG